MVFSKPPERGVKPQNGEIQDTWKHRQALRSMELVSCLHPAANTVTQTQKRNRNLGYSKQAASETVRGC